MQMSTRNISSVAVVCVAMLLSSCTSHPIISIQDIQRDVDGKSTGEDYQTGWNFDRSMPVEMRIVESKYKSATASIVIDAMTISDGGYVKKMAGRLRLHYEWIAGVWHLKQVENLSFRIVD